MNTAGVRGMIGVAIALLHPLFFHLNLSLSLFISPSLPLSYTAALKRTKCGVAIMLDPLWDLDKFRDQFFC